MTLYSSKKANNNSLFKIINFTSSTIGTAPLCIITTRAAGSMGSNISPKDEKRNKIMDILGIDKIVSLIQEHTDIVFDSKEIDSNSIIGDGIITLEKKVLAVTVADCLPIFLYDSKNNAYGIVHSGWKGTGIALNAVNKMLACYGTKPEDIHIAIGPSIGKCCYSVDRERALNFALKWGNNTIIEKKSSYFLDLKKANKLMLENAGVKNITIDKNCTCCNSEFHSYRRDGAEGFGLMLALIGYFR